jgi:Transposase IS4
MPKQSNDIDLVTYTTSKPSKGPAPQPKLPEFTPLFCNAGEENMPNVPISIDSSDPEALFNMFFDQSIIEMIVKATNQNAEFKRTGNRRQSIQERQRPWHPINSDELRAYLGIITWMDELPALKKSCGVLEHREKKWWNF